MLAWDADGHVEESDLTFSEEYFDPKLAHRRPKIIMGDNALRWRIDDQLFPRPGRGPEMHQGIAFATPASMNGRAVPGPNGIPINALGARPKPETVDCLEVRDVKARLDLMDKEGIEVSVLYPTLFLAWPLSGDPEMGAALCRSYNGWIADTCSRSGGRLHWVAVIDPSDPRRAAAEMAWAKEKGALGTMVLGMAGEQYIMAPRFEPIWDTAAQLDMPMGVHVGFCGPEDTFVYSLLMCFERFIPSGILDRYPKLRVAFLEAGCQWIPWLMDRIEELLHRFRPRFGSDAGARSAAGYRAELLPKEYIQRGNVYFGFEVDEPLLPWCIEEYGADCFLWASDIPHGDRLPNAARVLAERNDISEEAKRKMLRDNVARFYKLTVPEQVR